MKRLTNLTKENEKLKQDIKDLISNRKVVFNEVRIPSDSYPSFGNIQPVTWRIATDKTVKCLLETLRFTNKQVHNLERENICLHHDVTVERASKNAVRRSLYDAKDQITKKDIAINRGQKFLFVMTSVVIIQSILMWY